MSFVLVPLNLLLGITLLGVDFLLLGFWVTVTHGHGRKWLCSAEDVCLAQRATYGSCACYGTSHAS